MWETIVWTFYNVIPWFWLVTTVIYFILVIVYVFIRNEEYDGAWDFTLLETGFFSVIVGLIGLLITFVVAFLIEKTVKLFKLFSVSPG